jgi:ribonuclease-3
LTGLDRTPDLEALESQLGHSFANRGLLTEALTHSSAAVGTASYERLEFLGDRVLGLILAEYFHANCPADDEGRLSLRYHAAARQSTLAIVARQLGIARHVQVQTGMDVATNDSVLSDVIEGIIAALYLDGGFDPARRFVLAHWPLDAEAPATGEKDAKSRLQEFAMQKGLPLPAYRMVSRDGPDHAPRMVFAVSLDGHGEESASAGSRKQAEQMAASQLLERILIKGERHD